MDGVVVTQFLLLTALVAFVLRHRFTSERARQVGHRRALTRSVATVGVAIGATLFGVWVADSPIVELLALLVEAIAGGFFLIHIWLLSRSRFRQGALLVRLGMTRTQLIGLGAATVALVGLVWLTAEPWGRLRYTVTVIGAVALAELVFHHAVGLQFRENGVLTGSSFYEWDRVQGWQLERPTSSSEARPRLVVRFEEALPLSHILLDPAHYPERGTGMVATDEDIQAALAVLNKRAIWAAGASGRSS